MDFGFAPGNDGHHQNLRGLLLRRANTTLVNARNMATLQAFIKHLETNAGVTRPIDNMLLGAHANSEGQIFTPMFPNQRGPTRFETLEESLATPANSIVIPDAVIGFTAGDPVTHALHFKGCNIGKARPYLVKFKEALGDHVIVTAPKHFHGITPASNGLFEYMAYEFSVRNPTDFPNRAAVLSAFQAGAFTYIDGSNVLSAEWNPLIPARVDRRFEVQEAQPLGVSVGTLTTVNVPRQFRVDRIPFIWTITFPTPSAVPAASARQAAFEASVGATPNFDSSHPFPMYERLGYATLLDFFAGYTWTHAKDGNKLVSRGTRTEYSVVLGIRNRTTGNLIFNFYPTAAGPAAITTGLVETDSTFFESV